jgi:DNA-damage-inducible protein J
MAATLMVHLRIDDAIKEQATETLAAKKQLPFALKVPNSVTSDAMNEARAMSKARFVVATDLMHVLDQGV